jgi:hypothetical protein
MEQTQQTTKHPYFMNFFFSAAIRGSVVDPLHRLGLLSRYGPMIYASFNKGRRCPATSRQRHHAMR